MTNARVLAVSDNSTHNRQVKRTAEYAVWAAETSTSGSMYVALFNLRGEGGGQQASRPAS
eukprot:SAG11_NODE_17848_length_507_cov_1.117647_2_plen_59_part_01